MNRITLAGWLLSLALAQGQGTINFNNAPSAVGNGGAPVYDVDGSTRLSGTNWVAQLFAGPDVHTLAPVGEPLPFRTGAGAGFFNTTTGSVRTIPNVAPGELAALRIGVWPAKHATWLEAALSDWVTWSQTLYVVAGGGGDPPVQAANLVGLESFGVELPGGPRALSPILTGSSLIVQWPWWQDGQTLEWTANLSPQTEWQPTTNEVVLVAGTWSARLDTTTGSAFFRLRASAGSSSTRTD